MDLYPGDSKMLFWKPKFYDTAKVPAAYRRMVLFDAEKLHAALHDMLGVALSYATEEAIQLYSMAIPLPLPDDQEDEDLSDSSDEGDTKVEDFKVYEGTLTEEEYSAMKSPENVASDTCIETATSGSIWNSDVDGYDWPIIEEPPKSEPYSDEEEVIISDNADFDPFESAADQIAPETNPWLTNTPGSSDDTFCDDLASLLDSHADDDGEANFDIVEDSPNMHRDDASSWLTNDHSASHEGICSEVLYDTGITSHDHCVPFAHDGTGDKLFEKSSDDGESSDEIMSEGIDDELEKLQLGDNTLFHPVEYYWPTYFMENLFPKVTEYEHYVEKKNALVATITKGKALSPTEVDLILRNFVHENLVHKPTVDCNQLFKIKRFVDNIERFVFAVQRNIDAIDADVNEGRRRHHMARDSPLRLRSKGLGSSLRFVTSIDDEEELGEDDWGLSPVMKQRQLI
ncbi:hypothetical protein NW768_007153 [Fusarium equiseti]|uniref:Uncharacterized protein n=1 Tax=Fusarium equiseti TaxID=61235 RepID=A0ABQ8RAH6_FUSEQ|nr:hypothetical protein NW768_007153 [Fusarium equiseti]